jgi:hypothetical protein
MPCVIAAWPPSGDDLGGVGASASEVDRHAPLGGWVWRARQVAGPASDPARPAIRLGSRGR